MRHYKSLTGIPHCVLVSRIGSMVRLAVKRGIIKRADHCSDCGSTQKVQAHHHNGYDPENPFDLIWLCDDCHRKEHVRMRSSKPTGQKYEIVSFK